MNNTKLLKIEDPRIKGVFTRWIKKQLKKWVNDNSTKRKLFMHAVYFYYDGDDYCVDFGVDPDFDASILRYSKLDDAYMCGTEPFIEGGIVVGMIGNSSPLDECETVTEKVLTNVAHALIESYNAELIFKYGWAAVEECEY